MIARSLNINVKTNCCYVNERAPCCGGLLFGESPSSTLESLAVLFVPVGPCTALPPRLPQHKKLLCLQSFYASSSTSPFTLPTSLERYKLAIVKVEWSFVLLLSHFEERSSSLTAHSAFLPHGVFEALPRKFCAYQYHQRETLIPPNTHAMTTASSIAFSNMEVPGLDDTMEMASPHQGHVDDFDIDLDIMEDHASNADKDMTAADDYPDTLQEGDIDQDGANDADMIDDIAEPTMVDADDQYQEASHNVEMQYGMEESHEEEMLEDEYVDDADAADAAVPEDQEVQVCDNTDKPETQDVGAAENPVTADYGQEPAVGDHPEAKLEHHDKTGHELQGASDQHDDNADNSPEAHQPESAGGDITNSTNEIGQVDSELRPLDAGKTGLNSDHHEGADYDQGGDEHAGEAPQPVEEHGTAGDEGAEEQAAQDRSLQGPEQGYEHEQDTTGQVTLHPVKVYYQDNEISLFPPREGDSSETFFLEDERLAYEPVGKLFESCREVLYEHVGENEVLVLDIESLNLQLIEVSVSHMQLF